MVFSFVAPSGFVNISAKFSSDGMKVILKHLAATASLTK